MKPPLSPRISLILPQIKSFLLSVYSYRSGAHIKNTAELPLYPDQVVDPGGHTAQSLKFEDSNRIKQAFIGS
jgi:hypothetical protein